MKLKEYWMSLNITIQQAVDSIDIAQRAYNGCVHDGN